MNTKNYAQKYNLSLKTVQEYCKKGIISGARLKNGKYVITEDKPPLYVLRKKENRTVADDYFDIMSAANQKRLIDHHTLKCNRQEFENYLNILSHCKFIYLTEKGYVITPLGIDSLHKPKKEAIKLIMDMVGLVPKFK